MVNRYTARLVIKGFSQQTAVDYNQTFSPVVRYATIRYLLAVAAQLDLDVFQMDAITAFLRGELGEEVILHGTARRSCGYNCSVESLSPAEGAV